MNQIKTYKDLLEEKNRLEILVELHQKNLSENWIDIKNEFKPVTSTCGFVKKFFIADKSSPLITIITGVVANRLLKKFLFKKSDWITRLVLPFFFRNYSSHVFGRYLSRVFYKFKKHFDPPTENTHTTSN